MLGVDGRGGGGDGGGGAIVEAISDVQDSFRELVVAATALGVVVPCAPEGAGRKGTAVLFFCVFRFCCDVFFSWLWVPLAEKSGLFVRHGLVRFFSCLLRCCRWSRASRTPGAAGHCRGSASAPTKAPFNNIFYLKWAPCKRPKPQMRRFRRTNKLYGTY